MHIAKIAHEIIRNFANVCKLLLPNIHFEATPKKTYAQISDIHFHLPKLSRMF